MGVSVVITVYNEEKSVSALLKSLLNQTKKPDEIVIVDGGSTDRTIQIIRHFQKKDKRIKLLVEECSRSRGRNLGVEVARNEIIAMTDAGCVADKNWLKRITKPFENKEIDVVAGFYKMVGKTSFQKALSVYLGVVPSKFDFNFLPSTRSIAFRKEVWEKVGGFSERLENAGEDTDFNYKLIKTNASFTRVKNAVVEWGMPKTIREAFNKFYSYAVGDAQTKIWRHPLPGYVSHNVKILLIFARYFVGLFLVIFAFRYPLLWLVLVFSLVFYFLWAFRKVFMEFKDFRAGLLGVVVQIISDLAVMAGFISGFSKR